MKKGLLILFLIFIFGNSFSQNINLELLDISKNADSNPREFVVINNVYYFIAKGLDLGIELWRSDGTQSGTYIVKDINQGSNGAFLSNESSNLTNVNGLLYFSANDGINGFELWKSDGTELGTVMVKDIASSSSSSSPSDFISLNSEVIFVCDDGINGRELWKTDGTSMGTVLLKDIDSGISGSGPSFLINFNNKVYFQAWNSVSGIELWMTDGTTSNTVIQNDLNPGNSIGVNNLTKMLVFNNELYFRGNSQNTGFELYKTDGSTGNSTLIINLDGNFNNGFVGKMLTSNTTTIFFDGTNFNGKELWKSNGTLVG
jgi:ELWxxDGT repeat protein